MKVQVMQKTVRATHARVLKIGYCRAQFLLKGTEPYAYTCGNDGWHSDIYSIGYTAISTGYVPFGTAVPYDIVKAYDDKAAKIWSDTTISWDERKDKVNDLLHEFIEKL